MSAVLGINLSHDTSVCLIKDGKIYAAEEERWSKLKHNSRYIEDYLFPHNALKYVLEESQTYLNEIKHTVCVSMSAKDILGDYIYPRQEMIGLQNVEYISHHKAHILAGYFLSPFSDAVGLCIDGGGSVIGLDFNTRERTSGYYCNDNICTRIFSNWDRIEIQNASVKEVKNALGLFYLNFAKRCVPKGDEPEGSMMALAAYGTNDAYYEEIKKLITLYPNGQYQITAPYGSNNSSVYQFGGWNWTEEQKEDIPFEERANLARAVQRVFEETVIHILNELYELTHVENLVFSGGCALNSKFNGIIHKQTKFKNVYIPPAPHDGGTAIGAALYAWNYLLKERRLETPKNLSWGPKIKELTMEEQKMLTDRGMICRTYSENELMETVVGMLLDKKVILWARGRMEFGPRALGNRSIIAYSDTEDMKERVNSIKKRAWYRPLAPSVLEEEYHKYFDGDADYYMNKTSKVIRSKEFAAITHKDETARVQLVSKDNEFYPLLMELKKRKKASVIMNTSLNLKGIPIANSKEDVMEVLLKLDCDAAVIGSTIVFKSDFMNE